MEKVQAFNPYLPTYEYIPDGEPHVFDERVYIYGSHDKFAGKKFCLDDYVCYSASIYDLSNWKYEGYIYKRTQDPRSMNGKYELWAPDVVRGKDGRFYLYYCLDDRQLEIGVAVCDQPAGKYEFLGLVEHADGTPLGDKEDDTIPFDPGIFIDDDGEIYLYSGNGPRTKRQIGKENKASKVMTLEDDMLTIKKEPRNLLPTLGEGKNTSFEGHEFFEAMSIRKINKKYYLIYSSVHLHELCYAISDKPDCDYRFGGVVISNADISKNQPVAKNAYGNNHGGLEFMNNQWYIFYHKPSNRSNFSRQSCADKVEILEDGSIIQAEMTSCGLNDGPLKGTGKYPAHIACQLHGKKTQVIAHPLAMRREHPYITQSGPDVAVGTIGEKPYQYITNGKDGMTAVYKYFEFNGVKKLRVQCRGKIKGKLYVKIAGNVENVGYIELTPTKDWNWFECDVNIPNGIYPLYLRYEGKGKLDIKEFELLN